MKCQIEDEYMAKIAKLVRHNDYPTMVQNALGLYKWYLTEKNKGRIVISCTEEGSDLKSVYV